MPACCLWLSGQLIHLIIQLDHPVDTVDAGREKKKQLQVQDYVA